MQEGGGKTKQAEHYTRSVLFVSVILVFTYAFTEWFGKMLGFVEWGIVNSEF